MPYRPSQESELLQDALLVWDEAVSAVLAHAKQVAAGGAPDAVRFAQLQVAVDVACLRCQQLADGLWS